MGLIDRGVGELARFDQMQQIGLDLGCVELIRRTVLVLGQPCHAA